METQLKFGIYYSYWEQEWSADCLKYVEKVAKLGFDVIEIAAHHLNTYSPAHIAEVGRSARDNGIAITAGLGPSQQRNLSSADPAIRKAGRAFFEETLTNLAKLDIRIIGGALHSYWPIDYSKPVDKPGDRARGLEGISSLADFAGNLGVNLCLEVLNRFENHVLNTAEEGVAFVREIGKPNVKVMLDTFHMNIEEDSFGKAIRTAGPAARSFPHRRKQSPRSGQRRAALARNRDGAARDRLFRRGRHGAFRQDGRPGRQRHQGLARSQRQRGRSADGRSRKTGSGVLAFRDRRRAATRQRRLGDRHAFGMLRASASRTAMRTATPISTCSRMSDCALSATSVSISMPRIHGAWMHDERAGLGVAELLLVEPEIAEVFARRRHEGAAHALALQAQHHDDVRVLEA